MELSKSGKTAREVYLEYYSKEYSTQFESFRRMLKIWKRKKWEDSELLEAGNLGYGYTPTRTTVQLDRNGNIIQSWIKSQADDDMYMKLIDAIRANTPHIKIDPVIKTEAAGMLEIPLFDMHWGIADLDYYTPVLQDILSLITSKHREIIYIIIGQDMLHNDNFNGATTKGTPIEKVDMVAAWEDSKSFWYNIIDTAFKHANEVKVIYSKGNHDKAMTWAFMQMLKERYGPDVVEDSLANRKCITYGTNFIGLTHGEFKKNKTNDLRSQFSIKFPLEFAKSRVKEIHTGHLHTEINADDYGVMCRRLCTGNITDDWSEEEGYFGALKRFMIFEWSLDKLAAIYYV
jgi:hypothetical protein